MYDPHFPNENTEVEWGKVTSPRKHSWSSKRPWLETLYGIQYMWLLPRVSYLKDFAWDLSLNLPETFTWDDCWGFVTVVFTSTLISAPHLRSITQVPQDLTHILDHSHAVLSTVTPEAGGRELRGQDTGGSWEGGEAKVSGHAAMTPRKAALNTWLQPPEVWDDIGLISEFLAWSGWPLWDKHMQAWVWILSPNVWKAQCLVQREHC